MQPQHFPGISELSKRKRRGKFGPEKSYTLTRREEVPSEGTKGLRPVKPLLHNEISDGIAEPQSARRTANPRPEPGNKGRGYSVLYLRVGHR
jgi:hypothetical protein